MCSSWGRKKVFQKDIGDSLGTGGGGAVISDNCLAALMKGKGQDEGVSQSMSLNGPKPGCFTGNFVV